MRLSAEAGLFDIEGTVSSIAFVRDVLFPFAAQRMDAFVEAHSNEPGVKAVLDAAARQAGVDPQDRPAILRALHAWSDADAKVTPLKELQGLIWLEGFQSGLLHSDPYDDAVAAIRRFHAEGIALYVYSSGSIAAQKLFFGHTIGGNMLPYFSAFFDTTTGPKHESQSYRKIAAAIQVRPERIVFFSDSAGELDAAGAAGMQAVGLARPQDGAAATQGTHATVTTFDGMDIER